MRVVCPSCTSAFSVPDAMIPESGRKLRCSKCKHQWHFIPDFSQPVASTTVASSAATNDISRSRMNLEEFVIKSDQKNDGKSKTPPSAVSSNNLQSATANKDPLMTNSKNPNVGFEEKEDIFNEKFSFSALLVPSFLCIIFLFTCLLFTDTNSLRLKSELADKLYDVIGIKKLSSLVFQEMNFELRQKDNKSILNIQGKVKNVKDESLHAPYLRIIVRNAANKIVDEQIIPYLAASNIEPNQVLTIDYPMPIHVKLEEVKFVEIDLGSYLEFALNLR